VGSVERTAALVPAESDITATARLAICSLRAIKISIPWSALALWPESFRGMRRFWRSGMIRTPFRARGSQASRLPRAA
jgi:hypothetical protein